MALCQTWIAGLWMAAYGASPEQSDEPCEGSKPPQGLDLRHAGSAEALRCQGQGQPGERRLTEH